MTDSYLKLNLTYQTHTYRTCNDTFPTERTQLKLIKHSHFPPYKSRVPQGIVLGSLLYILFKFDFLTSPHITLAKFADDIFLYCTKPRQAGLLDAISDWCANWRISVNPTKSKLVQFTYLRNTDPVHMNINDVRVPTASSVEYLGLTLDTKLTWDINIKNKVQKARQRFCELSQLLLRDQRHRHISNDSFTHNILNRSGNMLALI
jgi:hypothetical protein